MEGATAWDFGKNDCDDFGEIPLSLCVFAFSYIKGEIW